MDKDNRQNSSKTKTFMRKYWVLIALIAFASCSSKMTFENQEKFSISEAYFVEWTAGIKGGGSGYTIYIYFEEEFNSSSIDLEGVYFRSEFASIKPMKSGKYQAFIKSDKNSEKIEPELNQVNASLDQKANSTFPFVLDKNEAVISFTENNKKKYYKVNLTQKESQNFPM